MSGFGIHEQYAAGVELHQEGKRWREEAFLHQLSSNGSMMLAANHDELWRECLQRVLGQPAGATWERMRGLLRTLPASDARRRLWHASYLWWMNMQRIRLRISARSLHTSTLDQLLDSPQMHELHDRIDLRGRQLQNLAWCLTTDDDQRTITIVEYERSPRRGH